MSRTKVPAPRSAETAYVVFDLGSLRFEWLASSRTLAALTPSRRQLGSLDIASDTSDREAVFELLDHLLAVGATDLGGQTVACALYNPVTWQTAVRPVPETRSYGDHVPLTLDPEGSPAVLHNGVFTVTNRRLALLEPSMQLVRDAFSAHRG